MSSRLFELRIDQLSDFHVHPDYSLDAKGTLDEYCQRAIEIGLKRICFTTHYDTDPERKEIDYFFRVDGKIVPLTPQVVNRYLDDVNRAKRKYTPLGLEVLSGLEVDYAPHIEKHLRNELSCFELDYILGAVHCMEHIAITSHLEAEEYFKRKTVKELCKEYYQTVTHAAESGLFDCIAHLDCYRKYGLTFYGEEIMTAHRDFIELALSSLVRNKIGIEINTSIRRKGQKEFYPSKEILNLARDFGIKIVALGSDAHKVEDLGKELKEAFSLAQEFMSKEKCRDGIYPPRNP
jgi:histidinol-phosphatase (PHP family)